VVPTIAVSLALAAPAAAQVSTTIPNIYATTSGTGLSNVLDSPQNNPWTVQLIWNANQLTNLVGMQLTSIHYRLGAAIPNGYPLTTTTWADYQISFGPSVTPAAASTTIANNFLATPTLVRSGPLTVSPLAWNTGGGGPPNPNPWGVEITFQSPFIYTGGNLAMLVTHPGSNNPNQGNSLLDAASSTSAGNGVDYQFVAGNSFNATTGVLSPFSTTVLLSGITPIPEPSALILVGSLVPVVRRLRRRKESKKIE
jgi:hypothetical protein